MAIHKLITCSVEGCKQPYLARTFCQAHCQQARHLRPLLTVDERFWAKVDIRTPAECWDWLACILATGYGTFNKGNRCKIAAHSFAWQSVNGPLPPGMFALHRCDRPCCCNPGHIFPGTNVDNLHDMWAKGRGSKTNFGRGEAHGRAKLTERQVRAIRVARLKGVTYRVLAERYAVSQSTIGAVALIYNWKWLK